MLNPGASRSSLKAPLLGDVHVRRAAVEVITTDEVEEVTPEEAIDELVEGCAVRTLFHGRHDVLVWLFAVHDPAVVEWNATACNATTCVGPPSVV